MKTATLAGMRGATLGAGLALAAAGTAAHACPNAAAGGLGRYTASESVLTRGISFAVTGGGASNLASCPSPGRGETGFFLTPPHMELTLEEVARARVFIGTSTQGSCDPVILVRGLSGEWYWSDNQRGREAQVTVVAEVNGVLDIWVGSANGAPCDTRVVVRILSDNRQEIAPGSDGDGDDGRGGSGGGGGGDPDPGGFT